MERCEPAPIAADESGEYVPNLDILLPELIANESDADPDDFDYPVGMYPIPNLDAQDRV